VSGLDEDVCTGRGLARAQLALAIVNAGVALGFLVAVVRRVRRPAIVLAVVFTVSFVAWALLIDASTHGWHDLRLLPG